jgi:hypothetical protein
MADPAIVKTRGLASNLRDSLLEAYEWLDNLETSRELRQSDEAPGHYLSTMSSSSEKIIASALDCKHRYQYN